MNSVASGISANSALRNSESPTGSRTCLYIVSASPPRRYPGRRLPARRLASTRCIARGGAGAPCSAGRRRGSRARCRRRWRWCRRGRATSSSTACSAHARISTSSGESCSVRLLLASMRATRSASKRSTPSMRSTWGTRLSANSVRRWRSCAGARPVSARSAAAIWARLKNGTARAAVGRDVAPRVPAGERRGQRPPPSRRRSGRGRGSEPYSSPTRCPSSLQVAREVAHQHVLGVLPERLGDLVARELRPAAARPRAAAPQAGLDRPEAREAARLAQRRETSRSRS